MRKSNLNCLISYLLCDRRSEVSRGAESAGPRGSSSTGESSTPPDTTSCRRPDPAADPPRKLEGQEVTWLKPAGCIPSITTSYDGSTVFSILGSVWCHREEKSLYGHQRSPASCLWGTANQKTLFFLFYMYFLLCGYVFMTTQTRSCWGRLSMCRGWRRKIFPHYDTLCWPCLSSLCRDLWPACMFWWVRGPWGPVEPALVGRLGPKGALWGHRSHVTWMFMVIGLREGLQRKHVVTIVTLMVMWQFVNLKKNLFSCSQRIFKS